MTIHEQTAELSDRADRAAESLFVNLSATDADGLAGLLRRAIALGWLHGYSAGTCDGIDYAADKMRETLERSAS